MSPSQQQQISFVLEMERRRRQEAKSPHWDTQVVGPEKSLARGDGLITTALPHPAGAGSPSPALNALNPGYPKVSLSPDSRKAQKK